MLNTLTSATAALLGQWQSSTVSAPQETGSGFGELVHGASKDGRGKEQSSSQGRKEEAESETRNAAPQQGAGLVGQFASPDHFDVDLPAMPRRALDLVV